MKRLLAIISVCFLTSCVSYRNYYQLPVDYLERRQIETRRFETDNEEDMLVASAQVLQDLEFTLETSDTELGLLTATKDREMGNTAGQVALVMLAAFGGTTPIYDVAQKIYVTLVSNKSADNQGYNVRVSFARIIWNNMNESRVEQITDPQIYTDFFDRLSQSLFLTANNL